MKWTSVVLLAFGLVACSGGGSGGPGGKGGAAAEACSEFVKTKLEGKQYTLDLPTLAASMKESPDKSATLGAPSIIEPGLASEVKQRIKCIVRFADDYKFDVFYVTFI